MGEKSMSTHVKTPVWLKIIIALIPILIIGYLVYTNFLVDQEFNYFYDIGSSEDSLKPYLAPLNRTSEIFIDNEATYRDINHRLIYFSIDYVKGSKTIETAIKFKADVADNLFLGVKNDTGWNY